MDARMNSSAIEISGFDSLSTIVFIIASPDPPHTQTESTSVKLAGIKRIVLIFWTEDPSEPCGIRHAGQHQREEGFEVFVCIQDYTWHFRGGLRMSIQNHPHLEQITIVNSGHLHPFALDLEEGCSRHEREVKFEDEMFRSLTRLKSHNVTRRPGHISLTCEDRIVEIEFVSMWDYLENYDWSGEFTEDETRPWLDDICERD
jgi:hypothetical protein